MVELKSYECNDDGGDSFEDGEVCKDDDDTADLGPQWAAITQRRLLPPATPSHICTVSTTLISSQMMRMIVNDEVSQVCPKNYTKDVVLQFVWFISVRLQLQVTSILCTVSTTLISSQMMRMMVMIVKDEDVHICPTNHTRNAWQLAQRRWWFNLVVSLNSQSHL